VTINKFVTDDEVTIFRISGKLVSSSIEKLKASLDTSLENGELKIVVNCKEIYLADSSSVGLLISRARNAGKKGGHLIFCEARAAVERLISIMNQDNYLDISEYEKDALEKIRSWDSGKRKD